MGSMKPSRMSTHSASAAGVFPVHFRQPLAIQVVDGYLKCLVEQLSSYEGRQHRAGTAGLQKPHGRGERGAPGRRYFVSPVYSIDRRSTWSTAMKLMYPKMREA